MVGLIAGTLSGIEANTRFPATPNLNHLVVLTNNDDWQALFCNGVLVEQAHEIVPNDLAKHCPIASFTYEDMPLEVIKHLYEAGMFPDGITLEAARLYTGQE